MEILEKIKAQLAEIQKQKEQLTEELRKDFAPMLKPLLDKLPDSVESIGWIQYTPYFNDGDECEFGVHTDLDWGLKINRQDLSDEDEIINIDIYSAEKFIKHDGSYEEWIGKYPEYTIDTENNQDQIEIIKALSEVSGIISSIPEEILKDLFGDHMEVIVYRNGTIETEEFEHD